MVVGLAHHHIFGLYIDRVGIKIGIKIYLVQDKKLQK
jgi:hypothetical protein